MIASLIEVVLLAIRKDMELIYGHVNINGIRDVAAMVDCGALVSVCQPELAKELGLPIKPFHGPRVAMADGALSWPLGVDFIKVTTKGGLVAEGDVVVMELLKLPKLLKFIGIWRMQSPSTRDLTGPPGRRKLRQKNKSRRCYVKGLMKP